jgi:hypothetical protein
MPSPPPSMVKKRKCRKAKLLALFMHINSYHQGKEECHSTAKHMERGKKETNWSFY